MSKIKQEDDLFQPTLNGVSNLRLVELLKNHCSRGLQSWEPLCCRKLYGMVFRMEWATGGRKCMCGESGAALVLSYL